MTRLAVPAITAAAVALLLASLSVTSVATRACAQERQVPNRWKASALPLSYTRAGLALAETAGRTPLSPQVKFGPASRSQKRFGRPTDPHQLP